MEKYFFIGSEHLISRIMVSLSPKGETADSHLDLLLSSDSNEEKIATKFCKYFVYARESGAYSGVQWN